MSSKTITFTLADYKNTKQLMIHFENDSETSIYLKKFKGIAWSEHLKCFYTPHSYKVTHELFQYLVKKGYFIDYSDLKKKASNSFKKEIYSKNNTKELSLKNTKRLQEYRSYLLGLRLSKSTIAVYINFVCLFLSYIEDTPTKNLDKYHFRLFIETIILKKNYSISSHRQLIGALQHFSHLFLEKPFEDFGIVRPKKSKQLPVVLSQQEIIILLSSTANLKHRTVLALLYSSGLRIGECIQLQLRDIDLFRRQIIIRSGKGRKDRYIVMAESIIPLLKNYMTTYKPKIYFIEGKGGKPYSATSIRKFLHRACIKAGIRKKVTPHTLRHSYATHLIENGVNLRYVQELLGHSKPETTMIYTHVAKKDLLQIKSPLDEAILQMTLRDKNTQKGSIAGILGG